jgi:hypothetical protein
LPRGYSLKVLASCFWCVDGIDTGRQEKKIGNEALDFLAVVYGDCGLKTTANVEAHGLARELLFLEQFF